MLKVCWMTALAATIVSIKPQVIVSFVMEAVSLMHENAHLVRDNVLFIAVFLTIVLANLAVGEQSKFRTIN